MKPPNSTAKVESYLASLTKEELIGLILKLAPQTFFDAINAQFASQREAKAIFKKASKAINAILSNERLLYAPSKFEEKLLEQLEKLRGLWDKLRRGSIQGHTFRCDQFIQTRGRLQRALPSLKLNACRHLLL